MMVDILCEDEYDPYLQLLSEYEHSLNYKFGLKDPCIEFEYLLSIYDNDTLLPKLYEHSICSPNDYSCDILPYNKDRKFIETKVTALKMQGFNL